MSGDALNNYVVFGPDANCTLSVCPVEASVFGYRPSLPANSLFLALFAVAAIVHTYLGFRWKSWWFAICMNLGCLVEIIGYVGRIMLYNNPFTFSGFLMQIVLITCGPVFYTAAIYVTLAQIVNFLDPALSRFKPSLFYWIFIPIDIVCLVLQAAGGAISTQTTGSSDTGVDISLAGLSLQVASLFIFGICFADYIILYVRKNGLAALSTRTKTFLAFLSIAWTLIEIRCFYRAYELSQGYQDSDLIRDEGLFIALECVMVIVAVFALCVGHPGYVFNKQNRPEMPEKQVSHMSSEMEPQTV